MQEQTNGAWNMPEAAEAPSQGGGYLIQGLKQWIAIHFQGTNGWIPGSGSATITPYVRP